ncbi:MAG: hypothetical protein C5B49_13380 [Bdellovibrio sp.]|nr:MAG: hypothetical protein C5B49_13380 [Bdellovibrio sp.]
MEPSMEPSMKPVPTPAMNYTAIFEAAWMATRSQLSLVAGLSLVYLLATGGMGALHVFGWPAMKLISAGYIACLLKVRKGETFDFEDFFWSLLSFRRFIAVLLSETLSGAIIILGLIFLLVPGIYFSVVWSLMSVLLVRDDLDPIEAMKKSYELVQGRWWFVAGVVGFIGLLNVVGALCFLLGLLVTIPVSFFATIFAAEALAATPLEGELPPPHPEPGQASGPEAGSSNGSPSLLVNPH